jgi:hypothetical protein
VRVNIPVIIDNGAKFANFGKNKKLCYIIYGIRWTLRGSKTMLDSFLS